MSTPLRGSFYAAITSALELDSPREAVTRVKQVVIQELEKLDRGAQIRNTEYFNHTYVPDLVLQWPRDNNRERHVYLRFAESAEYLADGLKNIDVENPLIFGLDPARGSEGSLRRLENAAFERQALVTDSQALESFISGREEDPVVGLASNAVTQGGRGLLDLDRSTAVSDAISHGFKGAKLLSQQETRTATDIIPQFLDSRQSSRLIRFLHAVWLGSGGTTKEFPGASDLSGELSDEALEFLLKFESIEDLEFWRRVGRKVTVGQLARLRIDEGEDNLGRIIQANMDVLWARACMVIADEQPALDEPDVPFAWRTENNLLALRGRDFTAYIAEQAESIKKHRSERSEGVPVATLIQRAQEVVLSSLRLVDRKDSLSFDSKNVIRDRRLPELANRFSPRARVEHAQAPLSSRASLNIDFLESTAIGATKSKPSLGEILTAAVQTLQDLTSEDRGTLKSMLTPPEEFGGEQLKFFD
ncbi:hypothetical protein [Saccharopolyspora tripterygii]